MDQLNKMEKPVPESILLACFLSPFLQAVTPVHPFLGEREKMIYLTQAIRWTIHQLLDPFSFPKGTREMASQILIAQSTLRKILQRRLIPKRLRMKRYFREAILFFGIETQARGERVPRLLRHAVPPDLLPWWSQEFRGKGKFKPDVTPRD